MAIIYNNEFMKGPKFKKLKFLAKSRILEKFWTQKSKSLVYLFFVLLKNKWSKNDHWSYNQVFLTGSWPEVVLILEVDQFVWFGHNRSARGDHALLASLYEDFRFYPAYFPQCVLLSEFLNFWLGWYQTFFIKKFLSKILQ